MIFMGRYFYGTTTVILETDAVGIINSIEYGSNSGLNKYREKNDVVEREQ